MTFEGAFPQKRFHDSMIQLAQSKNTFTAKLSYFKEETPSSQ